MITHVVSRGTSACFPFRFTTSGMTVVCLVHFPSSVIRPPRRAHPSDSVAKKRLDTRRATPLAIHQAGRRWVVTWVRTTRALSHGRIERALIVWSNWWAFQLHQCLTKARVIPMFLTATHEGHGGAMPFVLDHPMFLPTERSEVHETARSRRTGELVPFFPFPIRLYSWALS